MTKSKIINVSGYAVPVNEVEGDQGVNYLIRVDIEGAAGYHRRYGWNKSCFRLLWWEKGKQKIGLMKANWREDRSLSMPSEVVVYRF